jgi:hypothetical protein
MSNYTFTPTSSYALSTHKVTYSKDKITIKLTTTGVIVYEANYSGGIAFRCDGNNFQIGTLAAEQVFVVEIDMTLRTAGLWLEEISNANEFIGTNDSNDPNIWHCYNLNSCPVLLAKDGDNAVIKCPCTSSGGQCTNGCYSFGS